MEEKTVAGLTVRVEGPLIALSFTTQEGGGLMGGAVRYARIELMIPASAVAMISLSTADLGDGVPNLVESSNEVLGALVLATGEVLGWRGAGEQEPGAAWFRREGKGTSYHGASLSEAQAYAVRDALMSAYRTAGNFRRG